MQNEDLQIADFLAHKYKDWLNSRRSLRPFASERYQAFEEELRRRYAYDAWPSGEPYEWSGAERGDSPYDQADHHIDLGAGRVKKGRIGIDHMPAPGVAIVMDLDKLTMPVSETMLDHPEAWPEIGRLPFATSSVKSVFSHHMLEHLGDGFVRLVDEVYRVLEPGGVFRAVTPLFPSWSAASDPTHKRYFMADPGGGPGTWDSFCGDLENCWLDSFSVPYTKARFKRVDQDMTPRAEDQTVWWTPNDARELRVALQAVKQ